MTDVKQLKEDQANILNKHAGMARTAVSNTCIYIRGMGFKCRSGSRREQVLRALKRQDEAGRPNLAVVVIGMLVIGFCAGLGLAQSGLI